MQQELCWHLRQQMERNSSFKGGGDCPPPPIWVHFGVGHNSHAQCQNSARLLVGTRWLWRHMSSVTGSNVRSPTCWDTLKTPLCQGVPCSHTGGQLTGSTGGKKLTPKHLAVHVQEKQGSQREPGPLSSLQPCRSFLAPTLQITTPKEADDFLYLWLNKPFLRANAPRCPWFMLEMQRDSGYRSWSSADKISLWTDHIRQCIIFTIYTNIHILCYIHRLCACYRFFISPKIY